MEVIIINLLNRRIIVLNKMACDYFFLSNKIGIPILGNTILMSMYFLSVLSPEFSSKFDAVNHVFLFIKQKNVQTKNCVFSFLNQM